MYKKITIITILILLLCIISGCIRNSSGDNEQAGIIEYISIDYCVDVKNAIHNRVELHINEEETYLLYRDRKNNTEKTFKVNDVDMIVDFFEANLSSNNEIKESLNNGENSEEQLVIWQICVRTNSDRTNFEGFENFPDYWEQLWDVVVSATDANDITEFGLETQEDFLGKNVIEGSLHFSYGTETDKKAYILEMDLEDSPQIKVLNASINEEEIYKISKTEKIEEILKNIIALDAYVDENNEDKQGDNSSIWMLDITTDDKRTYRKRGSQTDLALWNELFEILVEVTDAENTKEFGWK